MSEVLLPARQSHFRASAPNPARARRWLWGTLTLLLLTTGVGLTWDRGWHATHAFDTFYSPPHVFIYLTTILTMLVVVVIVFTPAMRRAFGVGVRLPLVPFAVPGALLWLGGGFAIVGGAGLLDDIWHTTFGLDETGWSAPHAMLGWGWLMALLGIVAARLALRPARPLHPWTLPVLSLLLLGFSETPFLGPFHGNLSSERLRAIARLPVLLTEPPAQHTFRIYLTWNITRANPVFVLLAALWAGTVLAATRGMLRRTKIFLLVIALWSLFGLLSGRSATRRFDAFFGLQLLRHPAEWLPLPLLPAALVLALALWLRCPARIAWPLAGLVFGLLTARTWTAGPLALGVAILAAPVLAAGAALGDWVARALAAPTARRVGALLSAAVGLPLVTGLVDLFLRLHTP